MVELRELRPYLDDSGNRIVIEDPSVPVCASVKVKFHGSRNLLVIKNGAQLSRFVGEFLGDGATCVIGSSSDSNAGNWEMRIGDTAEVRIADEVTTLGVVRIHAGANAKVSVGEQSVFGRNCKLDAALDVQIMHDITGVILDNVQDIVIGERVSLGDDVLCYPGVRVGQQTRVGSRSVIVNDLPGRCRAAGNPALVIEDGVRWRQTNPNEHSL